MQSQVLFLFTLTSGMVFAQIEINNLQPKEVRIKPRENTKNLSTQQWEMIAKKVSNLSLDFMPTGKKKQPENAGQSEVSAITSQIIGGSSAKRGYFPWQVGLKSDGTFFCGGSLISADWVLTAAHCADGISTFEVILGGTNLRSREAGRILISTTTKVMHPDYNPETVVNDLALLKLPFSVTFNRFIYPIRLPRTSDATKTFAGLRCAISGWGLTKDNGDASSVLKYVKLEVISNSECANTFDVIVPSTICTSGALRKGTCNGDSGGPLVYKDKDGKFIQIGIVSFGTEICVGTAPSAFARVASFLGWISSTTGIAIRN